MTRLEALYESILAMPDDEAPRLAYAADNGKVWIVLRPPLGAGQSAPASASAGASGH